MDIPIRDASLGEKQELLREAFGRFDAAHADISARACALLAREPIDNGLFYATVRLQLETIATLRKAVDQQIEIGLRMLDAQQQRSN